MALLLRCPAAYGRDLDEVKVVQGDYLHACFQLSVSLVVSSCVLLFHSHDRKILGRSKLKQTVYTKSIINIVYFINISQERKMLILSTL